MAATKAGIHPDIPEAIYHADPALSQSRAKVLLQPGGPARYQWALTHGEPDKDVYRFGRAAHAEVLGVGAEWVISPYAEYRSKVAKAWKDEQIAKGIDPIKPNEAELIHSMADAIKANPAVRRLLTGAKEVSMFAQDPSTGTWLRGRADVARTEGIVDYKTAADADPEKFAKNAARLGYHIQAAWYLELNKLTGSTTADRFTFVVQEKTAPYLVSVVELSDEYLDLGRADMRKAIDLHHECTTSGLWPGFSPEPVVVDPPAWLYDDDFEELEID